MIKCGIIGYGKMGKIRASALEETGKGEIVAVYDTQRDSNPKFNYVEAESDIIEDPNIDAVFVCTPNYRIKELIIEALHAGKHVFSEKPPAFTAAEVEEIREAESRSGKKLMYGFNHRHHESIKRMKMLVDAGELGKVLWMRGRYGKEVNEDFFKGWRADPNLSGGGIMLDQGIHMLDLFLHLGGGFDEVHAFVSNLFWKIEGIEDNVFAMFRSSKTGICASLHSTMTQWRYMFSLEVFLEKGALILNGLKTSSGAYGEEVLSVKRNSNSHEGTFSSEETLRFHNDTSWNSEVLHFVDCIDEDKPVIQGNSSDALRLMKIMDEIYKNK